MQLRLRRSRNEASVGSTVRHDRPKVQRHGDVALLTFNLNYGKRPDALVSWLAGIPPGL